MRGDAAPGRSRLLLAWSSGKDSAWALHSLRQREDVEVVGLLTTMSEAFDRVSMHGVRRALVAAQAAAAGLPLLQVEIPSPCPNEVYEERMAEVLAQARRLGIAGVAFGDLYLEDVRRYRERQMQGSGLRLEFPLWGLPTRELAEEMIAGGLRARLTCVDPKAIPGSLAGREFDHALLRDLPPGADPCGENGEFHTFAWGAPVFRRPLRVRPGSTVARDGFVFVDLLPEDASETASAGVP